MKRLLLVCILAALFAPLCTLALDGNNGNNGDNGGRRHHGHIGATEMVSEGFAVAALLGVGGYLVLRRRTAK